MNNVIRPLLLALLASSLGVAGCTNETSDDTDEQAADITAAYPSSSSAYVVEIATPRGTCTANVISQHYLLTAAQCFGASGAANLVVKSGTNSETLSYNDVADVAVHPSWNPNVAGAEMWDLALVYLHGAGMGQGAPTIKIYSTPSLSLSTQPFDLVGYGMGSDPGSTTPNCAYTNGTTGVKRDGIFQLSKNGLEDDSNVFQSIWGSSAYRTACAGDIGAGYQLSTDVGVFLFAVHSASDEVAGTSKHIKGTLVAPKMGWLQDSAVSLGLKLTCSLVRDHRSESLVSYYNCVEPKTYTTGPIGPIGPINVFQP